LPEVRIVIPGPITDRIGVKPVKKKNDVIIVKILKILKFIYKNLSDLLFYF
tara:strand:- start:75 stop:227 length:153 start_codon:yes stop_codon:yes gene_type:complete